LWHDAGDTGNAAGLMPTESEMQSTYGASETHVLQALLPVTAVAAVAAIGLLFLKREDPVGPVSGLSAGLSANAVRGQPPNNQNN